MFGDHPKERTFRGSCLQYMIVGLPEDESRGPVMEEESGAAVRSCKTALPPLSGRAKVHLSGIRISLCKLTYETSTTVLQLNTSKFEGEVVTKDCVDVDIAFAIEHLSVMAMVIKAAMSWRTVKVVVNGEELFAWDEKKGN